MPGRALTIRCEFLTGELAKSDTTLAQLERYLANGANPSAADYDKRTPLMIASCHGSSEAVRVLLARGADAAATDRWSHTAASEAASHGFEAIAATIAAAVQ
jgi:ankyrin repeat protein